MLTVDSVSDNNVYIYGNGTTETLRGQNAHVGTPHISSGAVMTDLGNDSISITACNAYMKITNSDDAILQQIIVPADTFFIPDDLNYSVYIDYNGGTPTYAIRQSTAGYFYSNWDNLIFAVVVNNRNEIKINNFKDNAINPEYKDLLGLANSDPIRVLGDGITTTDAGTRTFSTSVGAALFGNEYQVIMPINTSSTDTFTRIYYDSQWERIEGEQTINNTHYNDTANGLVALNTGFFANKWLYYVTDQPSFWVVLEGQSQYGSFSDAAVVTEPSFIPPELNQFYAGAFLVAKFIVQEGKTEFIDIQNTSNSNYGQRPVTTSKSYSFTSQGVGSGTYYIAGYYDVSTTDANLTQASTTQTFGTANASYASHPFVVAGGAGTVDAGTIGLRVTGTRIQDNGTRTASYADTIITDITSQTLDEYTEAVKFIGTVTFELIVTSGTPTTYSFDFNYGLVKYEDFGNNDFDITGFEVVGTAGATDANFNITLIHHNDEDWTYAATGFDITPTEITDLQTVHNTEYQLSNGEPFAFKRVPLNYASVIHGGASEGVLIRVVTSANNSVQSMDAHIGVRIVE